MLYLRETAWRRLFAGMAGPDKMSHPTWNERIRNFKK
jgi:hypothetical protein